jgi:hypothetical protein
VNDTVAFAPFRPYLKRATWRNHRQSAGAWKVWDRLILENGTELQLLASGESFRIAGIPGEYYVLRDDVKKLAAMLHPTQRKH